MVSNNDFDSYNYMKTSEKIFYDWLLSDDEQRKANNPFSKMMTNIADSWPKVKQPKFN